MIKYPLHFRVEASSPSGISTPLEGKGEDFPSIHCAIPKEFNGPGGGYSPEELFALAGVTCIMATFKVFAERGKLSYASIAGEAKLTIDRNEEGVAALQKLEMTFTFSGVADEEKAKVLLAESQKYCLVCNAIKCVKSFTTQFIPA
ncbi:MAG: hypothetical protein KR126chlam1_00569 [Chlamydiae bacterium]|nr:hypothetical protein [Chlamydiota bacterium]